MNRSGRIYRLSVSLRRFELDLLRGPQCSFIEPVAEPASHIEHLHFTGSSEQNPDEDLTFNPGFSCIVGVVGFGFE
jgi:hypothetical protein